VGRFDRYSSLSKASAIERSRTGQPLADEDGTKKALAEASASFIS
jgi:hypothetical protein